VMFCDLRGFTGFAETAEPEEVMAVLRDYHACLGELIFKYGGTLERFVGAGLLVVMNDPLPCPDHPARTVRMAIEMRECMGALSATWRRRGHDLGFGIGIAQGYATLGKIGFEGRVDYAVIGTVPNLASRLCGEAGAGQILVSHRVFTSIEDQADANLIGELKLKGFHRPVPAYEVLAWRRVDAPDATSSTAPA
jgi:adenylate cyclase